MTTEPTKPTPPLKAVSKLARGWSTKTLARQLAHYVRDNNIKQDQTVFDLFESLKRSIVAEAIGTSLDL